MSERPTVEIVVRRNRNGSVLAFADRDRAARLLEDHRGVLSTLYDLVDRRHGSDGETVAKIVVRDDERVVDDLDVDERFRRDLEVDRAISLAEDLRDAAGERQLVTDGGQSVDRDEQSVTIDGDRVPVVQIDRFDGDVIVSVKVSTAVRQGFDFTGIWQCKPVTASIGGREFSATVSGCTIEHGVAAIRLNEGTERSDGGGR